MGVAVRQAGLGREPFRNSFTGLVELNHCVQGGRIGWRERQWFNKRCLAQSDSRPVSRPNPARLVAVVEGGRDNGSCLLDEWRVD